MYQGLWSKPHMKLKMISCEVFARLVYSAAAKSPHIVDLEFTALRSHTNPGKLRQEIQSAIDRASEGYDAILLGYGLCGNGTAGLKARSIPLVIPRAHDCCTVFLGSRSAFLEHFGQTPSAEWSSVCYYERLGGWYHDGAMGGADAGNDEYFRELTEKYGEDNARYIIEMMEPKNDIGFLTFIGLPGIDDTEARESFIRHAGEAGKETRFIDGSTRLIDMLAAGGWNDEEFLVVPPGAEIKPVYDHDIIFSADRKEMSSED